MIHIKPSSDLPAKPAYDSLGTHHYHHLAFLAENSDYPFRVWDDSSQSCLARSHDPAVAGFTAKHAAFHEMDESQYCRTFHKLYRERGKWLHQPLMCATVVRHTAGEQDNIMRIQPIDQQLAVLQIQDDSSPWTSTSGSLRWATLEVCRRLAMDPNRVIHLTVLRRPIQGVELRTRAASVLERHMEDLIQSKEWNAVESVLALKMKAVQSQEVLWYGRIFSKSVVSDMIWTEQSPAFAFPATFLTPHHSVEPILPWLSKLSWNPEQDDWSLNQRKTEMRRKELAGEEYRHTSKVPPHWLRESDDRAKRQRTAE